MPKTLFERMSEAQSPPMTTGLIDRPCTTPPEGWWCSRGEGHPGPCAARPKSALLYRLKLIAAWTLRGGPTPKEKKPNVHAAVTEAAQALEKMREALTTAEQTFWRYGDLHRAKLGPHLTDEERRQIIEKVERNYGYAEEMAEALSLLEEK
jgi:hypothetical protein